MPYYIRDPKRDHNFDNHPHASRQARLGEPEVQLSREVAGDREGFWGHPFEALAEVLMAALWVFQLSGFDFAMPTTNTYAQPYQISMRRRWSESMFYRHRSVCNLSNEDLEQLGALRHASALAEALSCTWGI